MPSFSQRMGLKPIDKLVQRESFDEETRSRLWNDIQVSIWNHWEYYFGTSSRGVLTRIVEDIVAEVWSLYLKKPLDAMPKFYPENLDLHTSSYRVIRAYFFNAKWNEILDFIEFLLEAKAMHQAQTWKYHLGVRVNATLKEENTAYRLIDDRFAEITSEDEIRAISEAQESPYKAVSDHINQAAIHLWNRKSSDYRNSIKEAISAVESMCRALTGNPKASLGECLGPLDKRIPMHGAFKDALHKLYGYASDEGGLRHGLIEGRALRHLPRQNLCS